MTCLFTTMFPKWEFLNYVSIHAVKFKFMYRPLPLSFFTLFYACRKKNSQVNVEKLLSC